MIDLIRQFFGVPLPRRSAWDIIFWWEKRRIIYNLFLAAAGLSSLLIFFAAIIASGLPRGEDAEEPLLIFLGGIICFVFGNICYSAGWIIEVLLFRENIPSHRIAPIFLKLGVAFSAAVIFLPAILWVIIYICTWFGYRPFSDL